MDNLKRDKLMRTLEDAVNTITRQYQKENKSRIGIVLLATIPNKVEDNVQVIQVANAPYRIAKEVIKQAYLSTQEEEKSS